MTTPTFTRAQLWDHQCTHDQYYGQWAPKLIESLKRYMNEEVIKHSKDPSFNDIPLYLWDNYTYLIPMEVRRSIAEANRSTNKNNEASYSPVDLVWVAKAAARLIRGW